MNIQEPITYEAIRSSLQSQFKDFTIEIRAGYFEPYVHVKTTYFQVSFNIWYSAKERTFEITDGSVSIRNRLNATFDITRPQIWKSFPFEFNQSKKRHVKRKLEFYLRTAFSNNQ